MTAGVPLRAVLELPPLRDARVVAGAGGLDRPVRHVNVMEVPDILRWVNPDELLLTTAYPLRNDPAALLDLVPGLSAKGLAGLALKPARYIDAIPQAMLESADALDFPLIELPHDSSFNDIINSVLTVILNTQAARLQRTAEIHERFTAIVLGGGGLPQIAEALAAAIDRPIVIVDAQRQVQTTTGGAEALARDAAGLAGLDAEVGSTGAPTRLAVGAHEAFAQPIQAGSERFGAILAVGDGDLADDQVDALEYAATVAALRQVQARVVAEADRRFESVCLEELVTGHVDRAVLLERAAAFKWDLSIARAVVLVRLDARGGQPFAQLAGTSEEATVRRRLADTARTAFGRQAITWERSAEVAALVAAPHEATAAESAGRLVAEWGRIEPSTAISAGIGRVVSDPLRLAESYREARRALEIGAWAAGPGQVTDFRDLGVDRLLIGLPDAELADFEATILRPLLDHDARHRTELVATVEAYLATRNAAAAARRLFVHYNTMKNRLRLVEEVLGWSLDDPDRSLALGIALRIRRLARLSRPA
jgi:purine catabolism regulator